MKTFFVFESVDFLNYILNQVEWVVVGNSNLQHTHTDISVWPSVDGCFTLSAQAVCNNEYGSSYLVGMHKQVQVPEQYLPLLPIALQSGTFTMTIEA